MNTLMDLDEIRVKLSAGIGAISVIADGLSCYTHDSCLSGKNAMQYVNTLNAVYDTLAVIARELEATLDAANERFCKMADELKSERDIA